MAAIVFPLNPQLSDTFSFESRSWVWTGVAWRSTYIYTYEIDGGEPGSSQTNVVINIDGGTV